ncbi:MAG TPA: hypothetical protein VMX13_15210 [Sedimentisphaerales bacterium]|nr:hypothetical protein [Sedimentisphaerales bacterium]
MKNEEIYSAWAEQSRRIEVSRQFSQEVMRQIYQRERQKRRWPFEIQHLVELISARPLTKVALLGTGAVIGLIRIACTLLPLLGQYDYCG